MACVVCEECVVKELECCLFFFCCFLTKKERTNKLVNDVNEVFTILATDLEKVCKCVCVVFCEVGNDFTVNFFCCYNILAFDDFACAFGDVICLISECYCFAVFSCRNILALCICLIDGSLIVSLKCRVNVFRHKVCEYTAESCTEEIVKELAYDRIRELEKCEYR